MQNLLSTALEAGSNTPPSTAVLARFMAMSAAPLAIGEQQLAGLPELTGLGRAELSELLATQHRHFQQDIERSGESGARLSGLRAGLAAAGVTGFVIPLRDEYFGEYLPLCSQRLTWLSGFSGSAGMCIVLGDRACIWSDGRYTLQLQVQVDQQLFECRHITEDTPEDWLATHLVASDVLAYDPRLHTLAESDRWADICATAGASTRALWDNPIDQIWNTRPPAPLSPVTAHSLEYSGESSESKIQKVVAHLADASADAVLLNQSDSIAWLLNVRGGDVANTPFVLSFFVLQRDGSGIWFVDGDKLDSALPGTLPQQVSTRSIGELESYLADQGAAGKTIMMDLRTLGTGFQLRLRESGGEILDRPDPCQLPKAIKNAVELAGTRKAHIIDGVAVTRFLYWLDKHPDLSQVSELQAADELQRLRMCSGELVSLSFDTISGAASNGAIVHYRVTPESDKKLQPGSLFLVDSGGQYRFGTTDITRTIAVGQPTQEMKHHYTLVLKGHIALASARFPVGTQGAQLDTLARYPLWQAGLDYDHGTGHGVSSFLSVHEGPQGIGKGRSTQVLQPGMILSNEPGYYKAGGYGIRIENLVIVIESKEAGDEREMLAFETITLAPLDPNLILLDELGAPERQWLTHYQARVSSTIGPLLDDDVRSWLEGRQRAQ